MAPALLPNDWHTNSALAPAIVFATCYLPLSGWFTFKAVEGAAAAKMLLLGFCLVRLAGFILRAVEISVIGGNFTIDMVDKVLDLTGLFALLYATFTSVVQRDHLLDLPPPLSRALQRFLKTRCTIFILFGMIGMALGIAAATQTPMSHQILSDKAVDILTKTSSTIFLALSVCLTWQTAVLIKHERERSYKFAPIDRSIGGEHGAFIFGIVSVLMLIREMFMMITVDERWRQADERFAYPLVALPELLAVLLLCAPGLLRRRSGGLPT